MSTVVDVVVRIHQSNAGNPIPSLLCLLCVCIVVCVSSKTSTKVEEAAVRDRVLVIVSGKVLVHLPSEPGKYQNASLKREQVNLPSTAQSLDSQSFSLSIEYCLCKRQPRRLIRRWVLEVSLSGSHGGHSPKSLIVVAHGLRPI
jgi:hypothetical protein